MISKRGEMLVQDKKFINLMRLIEEDNFTLNNCVPIAEKILEIFKK